MIKLLSIKKLSYNALLFSMLLTGLWFPKIGIPFLFILLILLLKKLIPAPSNLLKIQYVLVVLFISTYTLFWKDPSIQAESSYFKNKELFMFVELIIILTCVFWIVMYIRIKDNLITILNVYAMGMYLKSLIIVSYTLINKPFLLSLRQLFDPFAMKICNSPAISLMAVYGTLFGIYNISKINTTYILKIFNLLIVIIGITIGFLLQARTFFVILIIFLIYITLIQVKMKNIIRTIFVLSLGFSVLFALNGLSRTNKLYSNTVENTIHRFQRENIQSNRYKQWESAINIIIRNPLGGGSTDKRIEHTYWFHNLWLDIGRTSGLIPLIIIIAFQFLTLIAMRNIYKIRSNFNTHFLGIFYYALLIGLFVEIALEGNIVLFVFYILNSSVVLRYLQIENNEKKQISIIKQGE